VSQDQARTTEAVKAGTIHDCFDPEAMLMNPARKRSPVASE
jgi:hypothetical protein